MIKDKKNEIIEDVMSEFEVNHKGVHTETQHFKCVRDTGYNFDAIVSDLEQGGTKNVEYVAQRYWEGAITKKVQSSYNLPENERIVPQSNLGRGEQIYAIEVNKLLEKRLHKEDVDKSKVSLLINTINEIVLYGGEAEWQKKWSDLVRLRDGREVGIKKLFYEWNDEMDIIRKIQKCQRVWDHKTPMMKEVIDYLLWTAQNAPSKQHEAYYDIYWTADRKVLEELSNYTWGTTHSRTPPSTWKNSQQNADMYMLFVAKEPDTQLNCNADGTLKGNATAARWENAYVSIGIAIGLVMRAAAKIGYATGGNKSHNDMNGDDFWEKKLGILDEVNNGEKQIAYGIGIGIPKEGVERYESDQTLLAIGAANGSNLSLDSFKLDKHPRTGKKFRKIKIVDIKKDAGKKIQDPYGNWHAIPHKADIKINTMRVRHINCTEIK